MAVGFGLAMFVVGVALLWYGATSAARCCPISDGSAPAHVRTVRRHFGYTCTGDRCMIICLRACAAADLPPALVLPLSVTAIVKPQDIGSPHRSSRF